MKANLSSGRRKRLGVLVAAVALVFTAAAAMAQIMGDLPTLAPEVALPMLTNTSVLRIAGTWTCVQPEAQCVLGTAPTIEARIQVVGSKGIEKDGTTFSPAEEQNNPGRYYINATMSLQFLSVPVGSGVLNLVITNDGLSGNRSAKGAWVLSVMVEDKSLTPAFVPYISQLAEPRPDPITRFAQLF